MNELKQFGKKAPAMTKKMQAQLADFKQMELIDRKVRSLVMTKLKVPPGLRLNKTKQRQGDCYSLAGNFVLDNKGWILIHGTLDLPIGPFVGPGYEHAWAEKGKVVYEAVFNYFYNKDEYYSVYLPKVIKRFDQNKAREAALKYEMWGPWY